MCINLKKILFFVFIASSNFLFAQNENRSIYDDYKQKLFEDYDYDQYLRSSKAEYADSLSAEDKILISPQELKKLGVSKQVISKILQLSEQQDSIASIRKDFEAYKKEEEGISDSIALEDIEALIEYQKKLVIKKALSLPQSNLYGHEFFRKNVLQIFKDEVEMRPSNNYTLGVGDELNIVVWGQSNYNESFEVDKDGSINPELVGKIYLRGLSFENAKSIIEKRFEKSYDLKNSKLEISLNFTRIVNANFVGELFNPGTYRFPALNTVFNALVAIEGPNQTGSVRSIQIRRNGETIKILDLYKFLTNPNSNEEFFLEDNDYVVVPPLNNVVAITGQVKKENSYELLDNETLSDVINFAGGLKANAYKKSITIKRVANSKEVLLNVNLDSLNFHRKQFRLLDGDSVFVYKIPNILRNYVQVTGAVNVPGKYELKKGERVSSILIKAEGLSNEAFPNRAYVQRLDKNLNKQLKIFNPIEALKNPYSDENIQLQDLDTIQIISKNNFRDNFVVKVSGAVKTPGEFEYAEGMTLKDILFYAGGLRKEADIKRVEISRLTNFDGSRLESGSDSRIIVEKIEIGNDLEQLDGSESYTLRPFDHVFVRISPDFELHQNVKIFGEILYPGEYTLLNKEENITQLIDRAGGFTEFAFGEGATLYRKEDSIGFVILDLNNLNGSISSKFNYILTNGDSIFIPKEKDFVTIKGAINYPNIDSIGQINVPYEGNKDAKYYINKYGAGFSDVAKRRKTYVTLANGEVLQTTNLWLTKVYPKVEKGSTIFVDLKEKKKPENQKDDEEKRNWGQDLQSLTAGLTTLLTLIILARQASGG